MEIPDPQWHAVFAPAHVADSVSSRLTNTVHLYALHDSDKSQATGGAFRISSRDAKTWNEKGYGIFQTVQVFKGRRKIDNLIYINAWAVDMDEGTKPEMMKRIEAGLKPTMIVESKNGYHCYWKAKDATKSNYRNLLELRLVPFYKGDKKAKDLARLLRAPGYFHLKNPADPFLVRKIHEARVEYSEKEMFLFYRDNITAAKQKKLHAKTKKENPQGDGFWDRVWNLNCEYALSKLSGSPHVGSEEFSFRENASGTKNIFVNGESTSCWIDSDGRIGSADGGGPTIAQYLNWYHKDYAKVADIIREVFPECKVDQSQPSLF